MRRISMANNFKLIYKILSILEKAMEYEEFDKSSISHEALNIPYPLWCRIMKMLDDNDYIEGVQVWQPMELSYPKVALIKPQITLKGLEYLEENSLMQKAKNLAKGTIDIIK